MTTGAGTPRRRPISGLGPHGEVASSADQLQLSDASAARVLENEYSVAVVVHTMDSDWSKLQVAGISSALEQFGASLLEIAECGYGPHGQSAVLKRLVRRRPDGIISIPVDSETAAGSHRRVADAGIRLVLMDNAPTGLLPGKDYVNFVSADNFGNGEIAAELLAAHARHAGTVLVVGFAIDFPVTNERELGFRRWMRGHRPDLTIERVAFGRSGEAGEAVLRHLADGSQIDGAFVVWDEPALQTAQALRLADSIVPMTTVDLGLNVALEVAAGDVFKGLGAQRPFDQGVAEATSLLMALAGQDAPPWIALPALGVTSRNVVEAYRAVWHRDPPPGLVDARDRASVEGSSPHVSARRCDPG